jgi:hypothetical protein
MDAPQNPTLTLIDRARGDGSPTFAQDPEARRLERRARQLVEEFWSDTVWVTGIVSSAAFRLVCTELDAARTLPDRAKPTFGTPRLAVDPPSAVAADACHGVRVVLERTARPPFLPTRVAAAD